MKKLHALALLCSVSGLTFVPVMVIADPIGLNINVVCPVANGGSPNTLTNFGDYVAGFGQEFIQNQGSPSIYFKSAANPLNMPNKLLNYSNQMADYDSVTGQVFCSYVSSNPAEPSFTVSYTLANGKGGQITQQSNNNVNILLALGFR